MPLGPHFKRSHGSDRRFEEVVYNATMEFAKALAPELYAHFADTDDNAMEFLRRKVDAEVVLLESLWTQIDEASWQPRSLESHGLYIDVLPRKVVKQLFDAELTKREGL